MLSPFLRDTLYAHGKVLQALAARFGADDLEEALTQLEASWDSGMLDRPPLPELLTTSAEQLVLEPQDLDASVERLGLPEALSFQVWNSPLYRACIEPASPLHATSQGAQQYAGLWLDALQSLLPETLPAAARLRILTPWTEVSDLAMGSAPLSGRSLRLVK